MAVRWKDWVASLDASDNATDALVPGVQDGVTVKLPELATKAALDAALIGEGNLPSGGDIRQALIKASGTSFDAEWSTLPTGPDQVVVGADDNTDPRSEEHTSELQSRPH